jgi:outer membrane lipoprotein LolB
VARGLAAFATTASTAAWASLLLAGCAALPGLEPAQGARTVAGRYAVVLQPAQGQPEPAQRNASGRFTLVLEPGALRLDLLTPLGSTLARLQSDGRQARVSVATAQGVQGAEGEDAAPLAERLLGWSLPLADLGDWVDGRPSPGRPASPLSGATPGFTQDGWQVSELPGEGGGRRLLLERAAAPGAAGVRLKIVLDPDS